MPSLLSARPASRRPTCCHSSQACQQRSPARCKRWLEGGMGEPRAPGRCSGLACWRLRSAPRWPSASRTRAPSLLCSRRAAQPAWEVFLACCAVTSPQHVVPCCGQLILQGSTMRLSCPSSGCGEPAGDLVPVDEGLQAVGGYGMTCLWGLVPPMMACALPSAEPAAGDAPHEPAARGTLHPAALALAFAASVGGPLCIFLLLLPRAAGPCCAD